MTDTRDAKQGLLVVDDERQILDSVRSLFRRSFRVRTASSAREGLEALEAEPAEIILSDQRMPDMTGDEFLTRARELAPDSARILFTGYADIEAVTRAVNRGKIYGYVTKPWNPADLEIMIQQAARHVELTIQNRRLSEELQEANQRLEAKVLERTRELQELEDYQVSLLRSLGQGLVVVDLAHRVTTANPAASAMLDSDLSALAGTDFRQARGLEVFREELARCLESGEPGEYQERETQLADGAARYVGFQVSPVFVRGGERRGAILAIADITEKRQMEMQLNQSEKLSTIGQLAGGVAHEINNPLGVILGFAQILLKQEEFEPQTLRRLQNIERQALRCRDIVANLLKFARRSRMEMQPVDINTVITETLALVGRQLEFEQIRLVLDLETDLPDVAGDENELEQVVFNLITNARDAMLTEQGSRGGELRVSSRRRGLHVEVRVSDTGQGIPHGIRTKIFDPFFTTKEPGQGTGLGLPVSRGIVRRHKGELLLEEPPGGGTTFVVRLPIPEQPISPIARPAVLAPPASHGLRILVVDDEQDIRDLCADHLGELHEVVAVGSARAALGELEKGSFSCILLDIMMPEMDGLTALEQIRARGLDVPVVVMTGRTNEKILGARERLDILEVMEKPFSIVELDRVLNRVAGKLEG